MPNPSAPRPARHARPHAPRPPTRPPTHPSTRPASRLAATAIAALAALAALAGGPAQAAASADAEVLDLTLTLVDLAPGDGQAARALWADGSSLLAGQLTGLDGATPAPAFADFSEALPSAFATLAGSAVLPAGQAAARISAQGLRAWGSAGDGLAFSASASSGHGLLGGGIVLGPGSGLRLALHYRLQASVDSRDSACTVCDTAQAQLTVLLGLQLPGLLTEQRSVLSDTGLGLDSDSSSGTLALDWDNTGTQDQTLGLGLTLSVAGLGVSAAPVPEPGVALLLAAGLAGLGLAARGRRQA
jgi:hypothetical protein